MARRTCNLYHAVTQVTIATTQTTHTQVAIAAISPLDSCDPDGVVIAGVEVCVKTALETVVDGVDEARDAILVVIEPTAAEGEVKEVVIGVSLALLERANVAVLVAVVVTM